MSKMGTSLQKGKRKRLLVVSLVMAVIMAFAGAVSVSAEEYGGQGTFRVQILSQNSSTVTGSLRTSTATEVNLQAQSVFYGYSLSNVKAIQITSSDIYTGSPVQMTADISGNDANYWTSSINASGSTWTYKGKSTITRGTFNDIMAKFTLSFNEDAGVDSDEVTIKVRAFSSTADISANTQIPAGDRYGSTQYGEYSCTIVFYAFAQGELLTDAATLDYKSENANNYAQLYSDYAPDGKENGLIVSPDDANGGKVDVDMVITDVGGGSTATFGYQIKDANQPWTSATELVSQGEDALFPIYEEDGVTISWEESTYTYVSGSTTKTYPAFAPNYSNGMTWTKKTGGKYSNGDDEATDNDENVIYDENGKTFDVSNVYYYYIGTPIAGTIDLTKWDKSTKLHLTIENVDSGTAKTIRGYVQTDGGQDNIRYTGELTVQYQKPAINSFTSVQEGATYSSGSTVSMGYMLGFSDKNKVGVAYTGVDDNPHTGPAVRAEIYFTDQLNQTTDESTGVVTDNSKWYKLSGNLDNTYNLQSDGTVKTSVDESNLSYNLPKSMSQVYADGSTDAINSKQCAFKLVVTDLNTGYSVESYSKTFTIDSSAPTGLQINAREDGEPSPLYNEKDVTKVPDTIKVVGGKGAQVKVYIGNASDGVNGSGIKEYRYQLYYLASQDVPSTCKTTKDVMEYLNTLTPTTVPSNVQFTDWTPAADAYEQVANDEGVLTETKLDNRGQVVVAKDGYYRIDAKAVDNAGHQTGETGAETIPRGFFQVDLTAPSTPVVRLVKYEPTTDTTDTETTDTDATDTETTDTGTTATAEETEGTGETEETDGTGETEGTGDTNTLPDGYPCDPSDFTPYNNLTYTDTTVWLFAYSAPITGKTIQDFVYSTDGGLNWKKFSSVEAEYKIIDIANTTRTVRAYSDAACTKEEDFKYQAGICLTGIGLFDYQSILVKAVDSLGNESMISSEAVMRVSAGTISATAGMTHEGIEVALSVGNTDMQSSEVTPKLKNAAAKKINDKFFGAVDESSTAKIIEQQDPTSENFNPLALLYEEDSSGNLVRHQCSWEAVGSSGDAKKDDISCSGACHYDDCPYKKYGDQYSYYLPEYVNVSGLSSASASQSLDGWRVYDLNDRYSSTTAKDANGQYYRFGPNEDGMVYYITPTEDKYTGTESYPGQRDGTCKLRARHIVDITSASDVDQDGNPCGPMSTLLFLGQGVNAFQHFLFLPNSNPTKKTIQFSLNMAVIVEHTWYHSGFLFNSTIRQNQSGTWVLSGYRLMASTVYGQVIVEKITNFPITTSSLTSGGNTKGSGYYTTLATATYPATWTENGVSLSATDLKITNFQIICDGDKVKVKYTKGAGNCTAAAFAQKGKWMFTDTNGEALSISCPRPTVGTVQVGDKNGIYPDTDCYGFGPYTGHQSHSCSKETSVIFSDMAMTLTISRSLSEVVTEPQWGSGKAKFIANIDDNAVDDFSDPVLSAQIQWRLNNDQARYIGWGVAANKDDTIAFLERITGADNDTDAAAVARAGMYECNTLENGTDKDMDAQIEEVATYITTQYYEEFGFDGSDESDTVQDQLVASTAEAKGVNYDLENIGNIKMSVTPEQYNTSTANVDYPAGRWWMTHDTTGYENVSVDPRAGKTSDALETAITTTGRYAYYFAPDMTAAKAGMLDPQYALFDFVVSQKPVSLFEASIKQDVAEDGTTSDMYLAVTDLSYDPDCPSGPVYYDNANQKVVSQLEIALENGIGDDVSKGTVDGVETYTGTLTKAEEAEVRNLVLNSDDDNTQYADYVMLNGIVKVEWRWELLQKTENEDGTSTLSVEKSSAWSTESFDGKTLYELVGYSTLPENTVLTLYQRVTDTAAKRVAVYDDTETITGYRYEKTNGLTSYITQANVTTDSDSEYKITYPPLSSISLNKTELYDTAENSANSTITVTRSSTHPQGKNFTPSWAIDLGSTYTGTGSSESTGNYIPLYLDAATGDYYAYNLQKLDTSGNVLETYEKVLVLDCVALPTPTSALGDDNTDPGNIVGSTGGKWEIPYEFFKNYVTVGSNLVLQITESAYGYSAESVALAADSNETPEKSLIKDQSARAIQYKSDDKAPTAQVVTTTQEGGGSTDGSYLASSYLDVSDGESCIIITVGGSTDNQGQLVGYGYYFYDTKPNTTTNVADHERAWYYMDKDGALQNASSASYGVFSDTTGKIYTQDADNNWHDAAGNPVTIESTTLSVPPETITLANDIDPETTSVETVNGTTLTLNTETNKWTDSYGNIWTISGDTATLDDSEQIVAVGKDGTKVTLVKKDGHWVTSGTTTEWSVYDGTATCTKVTCEMRSVTFASAPVSTATKVTSSDGTLVLTRETVNDPWTDAAGNVWTLSDATATLTAYTGNMSSIIQSAKEAVAAQNSVNPIGADGGTITIGEAVMNEDREPAYSVNVAIFAYDNATGKDTLTGANQTTMTRVENIKLSTSEPMPPEIEVTNNSTQIVAHIGNDGGFRGDDLDDDNYDVQTSETSNISNSDVTVSFLPRTNTFSYNAETGEYTPDPEGTQTFTEDVFKKADLTGVTNVKYSVYYRASATDKWAVYTEGLTEQKDIVVASSVQLQFKNAGEYTIVAQILNGAGTESKERKVYFIIDKTPPTAMTVRLVDENLQNYDQLSWTKSVTLEVSGSLDINTGANAKYMVSLDDGKSWDDLYLDADGNRIYKSDADFNEKLASTVTMSGSLNSTLTVPITIGGTYTVRVKARDEVGNEQEAYYLNNSTTTTSNALIVKVDGDAPYTPKPKLEAKAESKPLYTSYLAKLDYQESTGKIVAQLEDGTINTLDRQVSVPTDENVKLFFFPAEGRKLGKITVMGLEVFNGEDDPATVLNYDKYIEYNGTTGAYYIELENMRADCTVSVLFPSTEEVEAAAVYSVERTADSVVFSVVPMLRAAVYATQRETVTVLTAASENDTTADATAANETTADDTAADDTTADGTATDDTTVDDTTADEPTTDEPATAEESDEGEGDTGDEGGSTTSKTVLVYVGYCQNGKMDPEGSNYVNEGGSFTVTLIPVNGYGVSSFTIDGVEYKDELTDNGDNTYSYTITDIYSDVYVNAEFYELPKRYMSLSSNDLGTLTLESSDAVKQMSDGTYEVPAGGTVTFIATPKDSTYVLHSLTVDGKEQLTEDKTGDPITVSYEVPEGAASDILNVVAVFDVNMSVSSSSFNVSVTDESKGTVTPSGTEVKIPNGASRTFTVETVLGYTIDKVMVSTGEGSYSVDKITVIDDRKSTFEVGVPDYGYSDGNAVIVSFKQKTFKVTIGTGSYKLHDENGTEYQFTTVSDTQGTRQVAEVPEGTKLTITPVVKDGYMVKNMVIYVSGGSSVDLGSVSEYTIENGVHNDITLNCTTEQRLVDRMQSVHSITVSAEGVYDINDKLADKPYRFRISDGKTEGVWTEWMDTYVYKFYGINTGVDEIALEPNKQYTVYVQTRDHVGNESQPVSNSIYTMANMPVLTSANSVNTVGVSTTKSVAIHLDTNQNPVGTMYMAYVATSSDMNNMKPTEWSELDSNGDLIVPGLTPGSKYWLQVAARNEDGISTALDNNIISITLSPASPEAYTLYYEEPAYPGAPIKLTWEAPDDDVQEIELYRDGYLIGTVTSGATSFEDTAKLPGDHIVVYSYAYVNSSGAGSSQTAVSKEYYDAMKIVRAAAKRDEDNEEQEEEVSPSPTEEPDSEEEELTTVEESGDSTATPTPAATPTPFPYSEEEIAEAKEKVAAMDDVKPTVGSEKYDVYSETMLYPVFPLKLDMDAKAGKVRAGASGDENSGTITVYMTYDVLKMERYQKYYLTLKAYEYNETTGEATDEVTDGSWDPSGKYHENGTQISMVTKAANANGAKAEWTGLSTKYVYKVFVERIESVGPRNTSASDGYSGQTNYGVEYTLGKYYYVDETGYGYGYTTNVATEANLETSFTEWSDSTGLTKEAYALATEGTGDWDQPIHDGFIKFNMSPDVKLATNKYEGNSQEKCPDGNYIVLDQSMVDEDGNSDMTFTLNLAAWDKDGGTSYEVSAKLGGTQVIGTTGEVEGSLHSHKDDAEANPYTVTLDAKGLPTGVYDSVVLYATDGNTTVETTADVKIVVNRSMPKVSSGSTSIRKIETGMSYSKDSITITSGLSNDVTAEKQNPVRLVVMAEEYVKLFGSSDLTALKSILCEGATKAENQTYYENALSLLTDDEKADETYVTAGGLTEAGLQLVISRVSPPVKAYFKIDEETYNGYLTDHQSALRKEVTPTGTEYYWIEQEYALKNNLCTWLTNDGEDSVKVTRETGQYYVELVANFGGNETSQVIIVDVMEAPSAKILTTPSFGWNDTTLELEFNYCLASKKVYDVINLYYTKGCITEEEKERLLEENADGPAARLLDAEGNVLTIPEEAKSWSDLSDEIKQQVARMQVFTMSDEQASISGNYIEGKIDVELGVYSSFDELIVYFATEKEFNPNKDDLTNITRVSATLDLGHSKYDRSGTYTFSAANLTEGTTYYLWSCFRIKDENGDVVREGFSQSFSALTTSEGFELSRYGFDQQKYVVYEKDLEDQEKTYNYEAKRSGSTETAADLKFALTYYQADEFGNLITDDDGNPIEVDTDHIEAAKKTVRLKGDDDGDGSIIVSVSGGAAAPVSLIISDTQDTQGHMVVRLSLSVAKQTMNATALKNGAGYTDIFVQDDESPVQTFLIDIYQGKDPDNPLLEEKTDSAIGDYYFHKYNGLAVNYVSNTDVLDVIYQNGGTGNLENITAVVYQDKAGTTVSSDFFITVQPTQTSLAASGDLADMTGKVSVALGDGKEDGVYEGWLFLTADHMAEDDVIKVHLYQVVGQSTLSGRIYVTPGEPEVERRTGVATVSLYSENTIGNAPGTFTKKPLYTTETDEYGYFTIPNILNQGSKTEDGGTSSGKYYIVVERDGFITYNSPYYIKLGLALGSGTSSTDTSLEIGTTSVSFEFNLRLLGGDVDKDQSIDNDDLTTLISCYNKFLNETVDGEDPEAEAENELIRLCDFNGDGVVNVLDRAFLIGNTGTNGASYKNDYVKLTPQS